MSSFVFYRFKSQKEPSRISFDGTGISVWDLKKEIIMENKMGKGGDFDFAIYNEDTEEEYSDDRAIVPRSTSVLARRLPPSKPGRGNAQNYMALPGGAPTNGRDGGYGGGFGGGGAGGGFGGGGGGGGAGGGWRGGPMSRRFDGKEDGRSGHGGGDVQAPVQEPAQIQVPVDAPTDEASALAAMFAATSQQWQQTQEQMATATPIHRARMPQARPPPPPRDAASAPGASTSAAPTTGGALPEPVRQPYQPQQASMSHKAPPIGYICYRCGQKGHWIQDCPTNNDRAWDDRPRIKRTTGIPKSFLTTVEGPGGESTPTGVMVTAEGGFVIARPDNASWLAHRAITKNLSANDIQNLAPTDPDLTCPICSRLLRDATLTPCCSTSFCEDCLHNALADNDMLCPECETRVKNLDKLTEDKGRRERVKTYIEEMVEASREAEVEESVEEEAVKGEEGAEVKVEGAEPSLEKQSTPLPSTTESPSRATSVGANSPLTTTTAISPTSTSHPPLPTGPAATRPVLQPMNPAQQAQILRQQQLQQQRAMAMQQGYGGGVNPQMLQQQMYQVNMTLQNPQLHPQMRMNLQQQLGQMQMMAVQMGLMPMPGAQQHRMGGNVAAAYGGNFARGRGGGQVPTGPRASEGEAGRGGRAASVGKRGRPEDFVEVAPERKKKVDAVEVPKGPPVI